MPPVFFRHKMYKAYGWDYHTLMMQPHAEVEALSIILDEEERYNREQAQIATLFGQSGFSPLTPQDASSSSPENEDDEPPEGWVEFTD